MRKARNILRAILFIFGIALHFASFYVSQVEQAPWVLNIVSPKSVRGMVGVGILATEKPLWPNDEGFQEISNIVKMRLRELRPDEDCEKVNVLKYEPEGKHAITGMGIELGSVKIRGSLSNSMGVNLGTDHLSSEFENMRKRDIFRWSLGLLIAGLGVVQIPLFFIQSGSHAVDSRNAKKPGLLSHIPPM